MRAHTARQAVGNVVRPRILSELAALVAPPSCGTCGAGLSAAGEAMCRRCRSGLPWLGDSCCRRCALPAPCRRCPAASAAFDAAWAPLAYDGTAREAVMRLKFAGGLALADAMAAAMAAHVPPDLLSDAALVPVPLHASRRRSRGFNQAERLAVALAGRLRLPLARCLARRGAPSRQLGAGRAARLSPARIEIVVVAPCPARAVLVDDVHTTGATLEACARALRAGGCTRVVCLTYARAIPGW